MPRVSLLAFGLLLACTQKPGSSAGDGKPEAERKPPPAPIDLSGYDRSCAADSDCTLVNPQPCAKCGCTDDPIAVKEQDRFRAAMSDVKCPDYDPWPDIDCGSCMDYEAYCDAGQCQSRPTQ
jgi:hypothetical protein